MTSKDAGRKCVTEHIFFLQMQSGQEHRHKPRYDKGGLGPREWPHLRSTGKSGTREEGTTERTKPCDFCRKEKMCLNGAKAEFSIIGMVSTETLKANSASVREALVQQGRRSQPCGQCFPCNGSFPLIQNIREQKPRHSGHWEGGRKPRDQAGRGCASPPSHRVRR